MGLFSWLKGDKQENHQPSGERRGVRPEALQPLNQEVPKEAVRQVNRANHNISSQNTTVKLNDTNPPSTKPKTQPLPNEPFYYIKCIQFQNHKIAILMQDKNGPCPIIAIANVLSLRKLIKIPKDKRYITHNHIVNMIAEYLLEIPVTNELEEVCLKESLDILPSLEKGMDVNVCFNGTFEFTKEMSIFDILNIKLLHGWIVDPDDTTYFPVLHDLSYNQAVMIMCQKMDFIGSPVHAKQSKPQYSSEPSSTHLPSRTPSSPVFSDKQTPVSAVTPVTEIPTKPIGTCSSPLQISPNPVLVDDNVDQISDIYVDDEKKVLEHVKDDENLQNHIESPQVVHSNEQNDENRLSDASLAQLLHKSSCIKSFLDENGGQLTPYGLSTINDRLSDGEFAILFRSNHFSVLIKHEDQICCLITDIAFLSKSKVIWECYHSIHDSSFLNASFSSV